MINTTIDNIDFETISESNIYTIKETLGYHYCRLLGEKYLKFLETKINNFVSQIKISDYNLEIRKIESNFITLEMCKKDPISDNSFQNDFIKYLGSSYFKYIIDNYCNGQKVSCLAYATFKLKQFNGKIKFSSNDTSNPVLKIKIDSDVKKTLSNLNISPKNFDTFIKNQEINFKRNKTTIKNLQKINDNILNLIPDIEERIKTNGK